VSQDNNKHAEAVEYWPCYLANDAQSEWAAGAAIPKILRNATATLLIAAVLRAMRRAALGVAAGSHEPRCGAASNLLASFPKQPAYIRLSA